MLNLELWRKAKKARKLTIAEIAQMANLPKGSVQNIFAGYVKNPRIDTVQRIENALGLNDVADSEYLDGVREVATIVVTSKEDDFIMLFRELGKRRGEDSQDALIAVMKTMLL